MSLAFLPTSHPVVPLTHLCFVWQGTWYTLDTQGGLLDLPSVQRDNTGRYRCRAENSHGSASRPLDVDVRCECFYEIDFFYIYI